MNCFLVKKKKKNHSNAQCTKMQLGDEMAEGKGNIKRTHALNDQVHGCLGPLFDWRTGAEIPLPGALAKHSLDINILQT